MLTGKNEFVYAVTYIYVCVFIQSLHSKLAQSAGGVEYTDCI